VIACFSFYSELSVISWPVTVVPDEHHEYDLNSLCSPKKHATTRNVALLGHIFFSQDNQSFLYSYSLMLRTEKQPIYIAFMLDSTRT
jgi:hypothetical protein